MAGNAGKCCRASGAEHCQAACDALLDSRAKFRSLSRPQSDMGLEAKTRDTARLCEAAGGARPADARTNGDRRMAEICEIV